MPAAQHQALNAASILAGVDSIDTLQRFSQSIVRHEKPMNSAISILALLFSAGCLSAESASKATEDIYDIEKAADMVIYYSPAVGDRPMKVSFGPQKDNTPQKIVREERFSVTSKPLEKFFNDLPKKDLIVIVYEKNDLDGPELNVISTRLRHYFVSRGFKKIFIRQANGGGAPVNLLEYPKDKNAESEPRE